MKIAFKNRFVYVIGVFFGVFLLLSFQQTQPVYALDCVLTGTSWNNSTLWSCGRVPEDGDDVTIDFAGAVLNVNSSNLASLTLTENSTLQIGSNNQLRTLTVSGDVTLNSNASIFAASAGGAVAHNFFIGGDLVNNGTFNATGSPASFNVTFNGSGLQLVSGNNAARFSNLTINNGSAVRLAVATQPTVDGLLTNNGTLQQVKAVNNENVEFLRILNFAGSTTKYRGAEINSSANLGDVTVSVRAIDIANNEYCTTDVGSPAYVERCYTISAQNPNNSATVTLWALDSERNGIDSSNLTPYHYDSGWQLLSNITRGSDGDYHYASGITPSFSAFLLGGTSNPTAVSLQSFSANSANHWLAFSGLLILLGGSGLALLRRRQPRA